MKEGGRRVPRFPESLRVQGAEPRLAAFGMRASVVEANGLLIADVDSGRVEIEFVRLAEAPASVAGTVAVWPFAAERSHTSPDGAGSRVMRVFAASDAPIVAVEWESADAADGGVMLRVRRLDGAVALEAAGTHPMDAPGEYRLHPGPSDATRLVIRGSGQPASDVESLMGAALARARRRDATRPKVTMAGGDRLSGAEHVLRSSLERAPSSKLIRATRRMLEDAGPAMGTEGEAAIALALLSLDERALARSLLESADLGAAALALVAGGWAAWTGDAEPFAPIWTEVATWIAAALERGHFERHIGRAGSRAALALAPIAAELAGDVDMAARLRAVALPEAAHALAELGRATAGGRASGHPIRAAALALRCIHEELGIAPDAPRGRLRFAPTLDADGLRLHGLTVGEARFSMEAGWESGHGAIVTISQTHGPTPFSLVVEPWLPAGRLSSASVDGVAADIDAHPEGTGLRARVQVVADHERRIRFHTE